MTSFRDAVGRRARQLFAPVFFLGGHYPLGRMLAELERPVIRQGFHAVGDESLATGREWYTLWQGGGGFATFFRSFSQFPYYAGFSLDDLRAIPGHVWEWLLAPIRQWAEPLLSGLGAMVGSVVGYVQPVRAWLPDAPEWLLWIGSLLASIGGYLAAIPAWLAGVVTAYLDILIWAAILNLWLGAPRDDAQLDRIVEWFRPTDAMLGWEPAADGTCATFKDNLTTGWLLWGLQGLAWPLTRVVDAFRLLGARGAGAMPNLVAPPVRGTFHVVKQLVGGIVTHIRAFVYGDRMRFAAERKEMLAGTSGIDAPPVGSQYYLIRNMGSTDFMTPTIEVRDAHWYTASRIKAAWHRTMGGYPRRLVARHLIYRLELEVCKNSRGPQHIYVAKGIEGQTRDAFGTTFKIPESRPLWKPSGPQYYVWSSPLAVAFDGFRRRLPNPPADAMIPAQLVLLRRLLVDLHRHLMDPAQLDVPFSLVAPAGAIIAREIRLDVRLCKPQTRGWWNPAAEMQTPIRNLILRREPVPGEPYLLRVQRFTVGDDRRQDMASLLWRYLVMMADTFAWCIAVPSGMEVQLAVYETLLRVHDANFSQRPTIWSRDVINEEGTSVRPFLSEA